METEHLKNFIVLTKYKNFSEAADYLFISQSTLSKRIKRLEEQIGIVLFDRSTKFVELNKYGKLFLSYAEEMISLEENFFNELQQSIPANKKKLVIGAMPSLADYEITELISTFMKKNQISARVITGPSEELEYMLLKKECDFAFIRNVHDPNQKFFKVPITTDYLVAVLHKDHPLANQQSIKIKQLFKEKFVMQPKESRPYHFYMTLCHKNGFSPEVIFTDSQIQNIVDFVSKGMGISLLMRKIVMNVKNDSVVLRKTSPSVKQTVHLCFLKNHNLTPAQKQFISFVKNN